MVIRQHVRRQVRETGLYVRYSDPNEVRWWPGSQRKVSKKRKRGGKGGNGRGISRGVGGGCCLIAPGCGFPCATHVDSVLRGAYGGRDGTGDNGDRVQIVAR